MNKGYNGKVLQTAKNHLKKAEIPQYNKNIIQNMIEYLAAQGLTHDRQSKYIYTLVKISKKINNKDFSKLVKKDIIELIADINNTEYSVWTKRDYRIITKKLIKYIQEQKGKTFNKKEYPEMVSWISSSIKKKDKTKYSKPVLTPQDAEKIAAEAHNLRDKAFILMLYESGARIGEMLNTKKGDYTATEYGGKIKLYGKTGEREIVVLGSAPAVNLWVKNHPLNDKEAYLFCSLHHSNSGKQGSYFYFNKMIKKARDKAQVDKPINFHHWRHSRATELAKHLKEANLCKYMGWEIGSKEAADYVHISTDDANNAYLAMHGKIKDEKVKDQFKSIECPRCRLINEAGSKFCNHCGQGLDVDSVIAYEDKQKLLRKYSDPVELDKYIGDKILEKIKEYENR